MIILLFTALQYVGSYRIVCLTKSPRSNPISPCCVKQCKRSSSTNANSHSIVRYSTLFMVNPDTADNESETQTDETDETDFESDSVEEDNINIADIENMIEEMENPTNSTIIEEDSEENRRAAAVKAYELKLQKEVVDLENILRAERLNLARIKDRVSESGKSGFFMVQAQVNDFQVLVLAYTIYCYYFIVFLRKLYRAFNLCNFMHDVPYSYIHTLLLF